MRPFLAALRFLTILPVPGGHQLRDADWGRATAWYPAVGLVLGALLAVFDWAVGQLWPVGVASALVLAAWVALTGALHLDGFVDCCDALLASVPRERRLEILRDVHAGTFGVVGAVLLLLLKFAALAALPAAFRPAALLLVPSVARWTMSGAVLLYPYARSGEGLGRRAQTGAGPRQLLVATGTALLVTLLAGWGGQAVGAAWGLGWAAPLSIVVAALAAFLLAQWIRSRLGGLTGDAYGAICEWVETIALLALAALAYRGILQ
jgi:adenosylcobinamide-GDP ribazoletransferase